MLTWHESIGGYKVPFVERLSFIFCFSFFVGMDVLAASDQVIAGRSSTVWWL